MASDVGREVLCARKASETVAEVRLARFAWVSARIDGSQWAAPVAGFVQGWTSLSACKHTCANDLHSLSRHLSFNTAWLTTGSSQRQLAVFQAMSSSQCLRRLATGSLSRPALLLRQSPKASSKLSQTPASLRSLSIGASSSKPLLAPATSRYGYFETRKTMQD